MSNTPPHHKLKAGHISDTYGCGSQFPSLQSVKYPRIKDIDRELSRTKEQPPQSGIVAQAYHYSKKGIRCVPYSRNIDKWINSRNDGGPRVFPSATSQAASHTSSAEMPWKCLQDGYRGWYEESRDAEVQNKKTNSITATKGSG